MSLRRRPVPGAATAAVDDGRLADLFAADHVALGMTERAAGAAWETASRRYREEHRHHHDLAHVAQVLDALDELAAVHPAVDRIAGRAAVWWHDVVYDPQAPPGANEDASADLARRLLDGVDGDVQERIAALIRLTADHLAPGGDLTAQAVLDADLSVLATDPGTYDRYADGVRREYAHVPEGVWRADAGRAGFLRRLADRPRLFHLAHPWEAAARANLRREHTRLTEPAG